VKIDVEGAEYATLQGAADTLERLKPTILVEVSDRTLRHQGASGSEVWDFLVQRGYTMQVFDRKTGFPSQGVKPSYFDSENVIAIHNTKNRALEHYVIDSGDGYPRGIWIDLWPR